ncbi:DUF1761 domain-containing protein [Arthrobacter oryzae]|uniref:DUF1761 domain-containing protein n=2 Tax=Arthrobacter oryzae TaxID=409290 RepID=A0A3N0C4S0_9MICC|nr:DUF1761 domain-containing protein [Arthrobacter oryzae]
MRSVPRFPRLQSMPNERVSLRKTRPAFVHRPWDRSIGYDRSAGDGRFPIPYYIVPFIGAFLSTLIDAVFAALIEPHGIPGSAAVGAGIGLAIGAATLTNALTPHTPKPYLFAAITAGYHLAGCTIVGAVLGAFP